MAKKMKVVRANGTRLLSEHIEPLPVPLTGEEFAARATSLVRLRDDERKAEAEFEQHKARHKDRVAEIAEERERLEQAIRDKREPRQVKVQAWAHYDVGQLREVRADTGEVLNERALLASEMQEELDLGRGGEEDDAL
jgi:hypothetical protein